jgi:hypothetical protein
MTSTRVFASAGGQKETFKAREEPFGLSLSKPLSCGTKAPVDKLSANGVWK